MPRANIPVHRCIRCLTAWECVNMKLHNQWGPFKVLQSEMSGVSMPVSVREVLCFHGQQQVFSSRPLPPGFSLCCSPCQYVTKEALLSPRSHWWRVTRESAQKASTPDRQRTVIMYNNQLMQHVTTRSKWICDFPLVSFSPDMTTEELDES